MSVESATRFPRSGTASILQKKTFSFLMILLRFGCDILDANPAIYIYIDYYQVLSQFTKVILMF